VKGKAEGKMTTVNAERLFAAIGEWSNKTFGDEGERGPVGPLKHMAKEVLCELLDAPRMETDAFIDKHCCSPVAPHDLTELADVLILLMDATRRAGCGWQQLVDEAKRKHSINVLRTYPKPVGDEISEHVRALTTHPQGEER
jgi:hypothetical protein